MRRGFVLFAGVTSVLAATALAGCSGGGGQASSSDTPLKIDGAFTLARGSDVGNLDPQSAYTSNSRQVYAFLYDTLVSVVDGKVRPQLASTWTDSTTNATFTLKDGVTCSNGAKLTADDVAANINYVADVKNGSPLAGLAVPVGAKATAAGNTVTVTTAKPTGFLVQMLANVPIVCGKGLADRAMLKQGADGTGPYTLADVVPGDHYTFQRRQGYTWGPDGATTATPGMPATVTIKIISNATTLANSLLSGSVNAGAVIGPDVARLKGAGLFSQSYPGIWGEFLFNQASGRPLGDAALRKGMAQALDTKQLMTVSTSGEGQPATTLLGDTPCKADTVTGNVPAYDVTAAKQALAGLSGKTLTFVYSSTTMGKQGAAGSELAVSMWKAAGVNVEVKALPTAELFKTVYQTGDWDIVWFPVDGDLPQQVQNTFSGPAAADGGNNFAGIKNPTYDELSTRAYGQLGEAGCADWAQADKALVQAADVVPFSVQTQAIWGSHATFDLVFHVVAPTSIRLHQ
ncbi:ABC transporter substrate-binding protein [Dactylosporangium sp. CA-233914]|uniref:ABC transporter substrate-binding protein n=1 Tax=Dactylosporangium sp. CA-233914 TaxID=3239934 RepID=UPI003D9436A8